VPDARIGATDGTVAIVGVAAAALVTWVHRSAPITAVFLAVVVVVSAWLSAIDFREHRLPNRIVGPLAAAAAIWVIGMGISADDSGRVGRAFGIAAAAFVVLFVMNIVAGFGMGDVKYGTVAALILGWFGGDALTTAVMVMALSGGVVAVVLLLQGKRDQDLAYGPYLALGLIAGLVVAGL